MASSDPGPAAPPVPSDDPATRTWLLRSPRAIRGYLIANLCALIASLVALGVASLAPGQGTFVMVVVIGLVVSLALLAVSIWMIVVGVVVAIRTRRTGRYGGLLMIAAPVVGYLVDRLFSLLDGSDDASTVAATALALGLATIVLAAQAAVALAARRVLSPLVAALADPGVDERQ